MKKNKKFGLLPLICLCVCIFMIVAAAILCLTVRLDAQDEQSNFGRAIFLALFMAIFYPSVCAVNAIASGLAAKKLFYIPIVTGVLFPLFALLIAGDAIDGFGTVLLLTLVYVAGGILLMLITALVKKLLLSRRKKKAQVISDEKTDEESEVED